jgi:hypothetical protein
MFYVPNGLQKMPNLTNLAQFDLSGLLTRRHEMRVNFKSHFMVPVQIRLIYRLRTVKKNRLIYFDDINPRAAVKTD